MTPSTVVVVPCYNEAARLDAAGLLSVLAGPQWSITFVDDGSTDSTADVLREIAARAPAQIRVVILGRNAGKGEAVRHGMKDAIERGAQQVAYLDADLATPPVEFARVVAALDTTEVMVALGARVALLGSSIERKMTRHYVGRIFASGASLALGLPVYDTQCGAKAFRVCPQLTGALADPFRSRWAFDVELLGRLLVAGLSAQNFIEVPLKQWRDVHGSKLRPAAMARAGLDLAMLGWTIRSSKR